MALGKSAYLSRDLHSTGKQWGEKEQDKDHKRLEKKNNIS